ncbi:MAG: mechanosensitive ion channel [Candidatus Solibacter usitatus]|nr:mechanosensitive ion channel [Candidatus Solibacter usitatus]
MRSVIPPAPPGLIDWAQFAVLLGLSLVFFLAARHLFLRSLAAASDGPDSAIATFRSLFRVPTLLWCLAASIATAIAWVDLPGQGARFAGAGSITFLVISICVVTSTLIVRIGTFHAKRRGMTFGISGVSRALVHVFILLLGATILLRYFGIPIAPLLTALGVGGLAVALALRDTLANFFAGIHILVEAPVNVGNFIRLSSGEEGIVTDIGWRTTRVLTTSNNIVVIPNEKITSSILTNYALPDPQVVVEVNIAAAHDANFDLIRTIAIEEAANIEGVLADFPPLVQLDPGITPTHLQCKLIVKLEDRLQQGAVQSIIRERLLKRFRKEGIPLPLVRS